MKLIKYLAPTILGFLTVVSLASASANDYHFSRQDDMDNPVTTDAAPSAYVTSFLANDHTNGGPAFYYTDGVSLVFDDVYHNFSVGIIQPSQVDGLPLTLSNFTSEFTTDEASLATLSGTLSTLSGTVTGNTGSINSINALDATISANLFGTSTSMTAQAASTTNGLMTQAQSDKLDAMPAYAAPSASSASRSITTGTGATGFQVSSTKNSDVHYSATIVTTATIGGSQSGTLVLETAATNSATAGDWTEVGRCTNGQAISLAVALQSVQTIGCELSGYIPSGYYAKIRSINNAGTPTYTYNSGQEVLR